MRHGPEDRTHSHHRHHPNQTHLQIRLDSRHNRHNSISALGRPREHRPSSSGPPRMLRSRKHRSWVSAPQSSHSYRLERLPQTHSLNSRSRRSI
ncbi:hypothetical protein BCR34DRAFT_558345 [Clohesyomyces aquaticus]|uniref:Uncharacterized protein n=1 Tax=Clohesyomyces aquaticus TaxID=1231657 RepID=A0A1Y1ZZT6_9PLEO|nr:hypothetical protein BCR34DRAFT_558345 [Clohesyomyces aquaticus]